MTARARETPAEGSVRWFPALVWLPRYRREWLRTDLLAALTGWALVVPQGIAYAQIAGLPPQAGLFATMTFTPDLDVGTMDVLESMHREFAGRGITLELGNVRGDVATMLGRAGLAEHIGRTRIHRGLVSKSSKEP